MIKFYSTKDEYGWMSNFAVYFQSCESTWYLTNEHYYQSNKTKDVSLSRWIRLAPTPYAAMMAGRSLRSKEVRSDWDEVKVGVMLEGLRMKFSQNIELKNKLLATGNEDIHEDSPTDLFWGILGKDMLGKLLMQVRDEFSIAEDKKDAIIIT